VATDDPQPAFRPVVLLPTYDNAERLPAVLLDAAALDRPLLVIDDGCTDETPARLDAFAADHPHVTLHRRAHPRNRGKGAALQTGFAAAAELGYTHAATMDTDGQHRAADAAALIDTASQHPSALVLGQREVNDPAYPKASRLGRQFSNLAILLASGRRVDDSQCGLRVYPLGLVQAVPCRAGRYGYEAEILTRGGWAGCPLLQVPIATIYPPGDERVSHFRPLRDTLHGFALHGRLLLRALIPLRFKRWPDTQATPADTTSAKPSWWRRLLAWLDPRRLVEQARRDRVSQMSVAAGLGLGGFVANLPLYPVQTFVALYLAKRLHVHPVSTVLGTQIAFPPLGFALIFGGIYLGHVLLMGAPPRLADFSAIDWSSFTQVRALMHEYFLSWWIGGVIFGVVIGLAMFLLSLGLLRFVPVREDAAGHPT
jgi:uncharacterized protein (DUF2062 family)